MNPSPNEITEPILVYKDRTDILPYTKIIVPSSMRSPLWRYFGFPANENNEIINKKKIVCCICRTHIAYNKNTSNLSTHLNCKHPTIYAEFFPNARKKANENKKSKIEANNESASCSSKRLKFSDDIDVDWYVDENTQIEKSIHPTGITIKEIVKQESDTIELFIDGDELTKKPNVKKSLGLDENFELVITSDDNENENQFMETLDYTNKDYIEMVSDNCSDIIIETKTLNEDHNVEEVGKDDFLAEEFLTTINDNTNDMDYGETSKKQERNTMKSYNVKLKTNKPENKFSEIEKRIYKKSIEPKGLMLQLKGFLIKDFISPDIVDGEGFKELLNSLANNLVIPRSNEVKNCYLIRF